MKHKYADLQVNGHLGIDFSAVDLTEEQAAKAIEMILASGTELFLPTIVTSPVEVYKRNIDLIQKVVADRKLEGEVPGVHLEGPFISNQPGAVGAHNPAAVIAPYAKFIDEAGDFVRMLTVAAEVPGVLDFITYAREQKKIVSIGHQLADYRQMVQAAAAGAQTITHLGNGMPNMVPRHNNQLLAGMACDELIAMIITDGHHLPPEVIKCIIRCKGVDKVIVTSDASQGAGLPPGKYFLLGNPVVIEPDGKLHNPEKQCLVGSSFTMSQCMNYLASLELLTEAELQKVGWDNPVRLLRETGVAI